MKFPVLTAATVAAFSLVACKSPEAPPEPPKADPIEQLQSLKKEQARLLHEKHLLEKQLDKIVSTSTLDPEGSMKVVLEEHQQALLDLQNIRATHPSLQQLNEELAFWRSNLNSARVAKREGELTQANAKVLDLTSRLHNLSKELPAIREAEDRITRSEKEIADLRRALAEKTPQGQALVSQINELEEKLNLQE